MNWPKKYESHAWLYVFKSDGRAIFFNKRDEVIKELSSFEKALLFAEKNIHLIEDKNTAMQDPPETIEQIWGDEWLASRRITHPEEFL